eukprot:SAG31_NODE_490_length_14932_cov_9.350300_1_plen_99_part_00
MAKAKIIASDGSVFKTFTESDASRITLPVAEWLQAAGIASLDAQNTRANGGCDTYPERAIFRTTGVDLAIRFDYSSATKKGGLAAVGRTEVDLEIRPR